MTKRKQLNRSYDRSTGLLTAYVFRLVDYHLGKIINDIRTKGHDYESYLIQPGEALRARLSTLQSDHR